MLITLLAVYSAAVMDDPEIQELDKATKNTILVVQGVFFLGISFVDYAIWSAIL